MDFQSIVVQFVIQSPKLVKIFQTAKRCKCLFDNALLLLSKFNYEFKEKFLQKE